MPSTILENAINIEKPLHLTYLLEFRTEQCKLFLKHKCNKHRPYTCFYWHFMNQRRRRPTRNETGNFNYHSDIYCTKYDEATGICPLGDNCPLLHRTSGDTERRYHLRYYKTEICVHETDAKGYCSKNGVHCAFAHGPHDIREPIYGNDECVLDEFLHRTFTKDILINGLALLIKEKMGLDKTKNNSLLHLNKKHLIGNNFSELENLQYLLSLENKNMDFPAISFNNLIEIVNILIKNCSKSAVLNRESLLFVESAKNDSNGATELEKYESIDKELFNSKRLSQVVDILANQTLINNTNTLVNDADDNSLSNIIKTFSKQNLNPKQLQSLKKHLQIILLNSICHNGVGNMTHLQNNGAMMHQPIDNNFFDISLDSKVKLDKICPTLLLDKDRALQNEDYKWRDGTYVLMYYKTANCAKPPRLCRQGYACPSYHNDKDRRRAPQMYKYRSTPCPTVKHGDEWGDPHSCENGDDCSYCHTRTEQQFHPEIFKTTKCHDMLQTGYCPRGPFCAFAHIDQELSTERKIVNQFMMGLPASPNNSLPNGNSPPTFTVGETNGFLLPQTSTFLPPPSNNNNTNNNGGLWLNPALFATNQNGLSNNGENLAGLKSHYYGPAPLNLGYYKNSASITSNVPFASTSINKDWNGIASDLPHPNGLNGSMASYNPLIKPPHNGAGSVLSSVSFPNPMTNIGANSNGFPRLKALNAYTGGSNQTMICNNNMLVNATLDNANNQLPFNLAPGKFNNGSLNGIHNQNKLQGYKCDPINSNSLNSFNTNGISDTKNFTIFNTNNINNVTAMNNNNHMDQSFNHRPPPFPNSQMYIPNRNNNHISAWNMNQNNSKPLLNNINNKIPVNHGGQNVYNNNNMATYDVGFENSNMQSRNNGVDWTTLTEDDDVPNFVNKFNLAPSRDLKFNKINGNSGFGINRALIGGSHVSNHVVPKNFPPTSVDSLAASIGEWLLKSQHPQRNVIDAVNKTNDDQIEMSSVNAIITNNKPNNNNEKDNTNVGGFNASFSYHPEISSFLSLFPSISEENDFDTKYKSGEGIITNNSCKLLQTPLKNCKNMNNTPGPKSEYQEDTPVFTTKTLHNKLNLNAAMGPATGSNFKLPPNQNELEEMVQLLGSNLSKLLSAEITAPNPISSCDGSSDARSRINSLGDHLISTSLQEEGNNLTNSAKIKLPLEIAEGTLSQQ